MASRGVSAGIAVAAAVGLCGSVAGHGPSIWRAAAASQSVTILGNNGDRSYQPTPLAVAPGDTVTWTNNDASGAPHNAVCSDPSCPEQFSSGTAGGTGTAGSFTFHYSGVYRYHCSVHPSMLGEVDVSGSATPPPAGGGAGGGGGGSAATTSGASAAAATTAGGAHTTVVTQTAASTAPGAAAATTAAGTDASASSASTGTGLGVVELPPANVEVYHEKPVKAVANTLPTPALVISAVFAALALALCAAAWLLPARLLRRPGSRS